ncbi:MAG: hypothetical protein NVSMB1_01950 [Polyangiales bacterium]
MSFASELRSTIQEALAILGVHKLVLGIHDQCFPSANDEDLGRGSPYSNGAQSLLDTVRALGFTGVQLGPQGLTSATNPSPYDGTLFARNPLNIDWWTLAESAAFHVIVDAALLDWIKVEAAKQRCGNGSPLDRSRDRSRVRYAEAFALQHQALHEAFLRLQQATPSLARQALVEQFQAFRAAQAWWLDRDALYLALSLAHSHDFGPRDFTAWDITGESRVDRDLGYASIAETPEGRARIQWLFSRYSNEIAEFSFGQFLVHAQHQVFRAGMRKRALRLYGDMQVGGSRQDFFAHRSLVLADDRMGAPPSRTNPRGQPWGYPVFDPRQYFCTTFKSGADGEADAGTDAGFIKGPVVRFFDARLRKILSEYDGIRVDHPHGIVTPWVYRDDDPDPMHAVQTGARLFSSPGATDHPALAEFAIVTSQQIDASVTRYGDHLERELSSEQIDRYGALFDELVRETVAVRGDKIDIVCEVLSTLPAPLREVMRKHGLGRFRVTQKANLDDPSDGYRSENAQPEDWMMVGNHDTPSIWRVASDWFEGRTGEQPARRARYLAERLIDDPSQRVVYTARWSADRAALIHAQFADLFASPARNIYIWFSDLFGLTDTYNAPGTVHDNNWSLRLGPDFLDEYTARMKRGEALDLPRALAISLRSKGEAFRAQHASLLSRLDRLSSVGPSVDDSPPANFG